MTTRALISSFVCCLMVGLTGPAAAQGSRPKPPGEAPPPPAVHKKQAPERATKPLESKPPASKPVESKGNTVPASRPVAQQGPTGHDLQQLIALAHKSYPGIAAANHAVDIMQRKRFRAKWAWVPQGNIKGYVAPASSVKCMGPVMDKTTGRIKVDASGDIAMEEGSTMCSITDTYDLSTFKWDSVVLKLQAEIGMPLWTFDKIGSARRAATAGVKLRKSQVRATKQKLAYDVARAYWGIKLAREILYWIKDGRKHLNKGIRIVDEDIEEDKGNYTMQDLQRLRAASAEVDRRVLEAKKLEAIALAALRSITGQRGKPFALDDEVLKVVAGKPADLAAYRKLTLKHRPDVSSLRAAVAAAGAARDLEKARFLPDVLLVAGLEATYAPGIDRTNNAFYSNPYNTVGAGFGLAVNWKFDLVQQYGKYKEASAQREQALAQQAEALLGIDIELQKALISLNDAYQRFEVTRRSERIARGWLNSITQSMGVGVAKMNDLTDALVTYYTAKFKHLEAIMDINVGWAELQRVVGTRVRATK